MGKLAYRFVPCDDEGRPRENSHYTTVADDGEVLGVGSVLKAAIFDYEEWEVVEVREDQGSFVSASDADGTPLAFGGTLVPRPQASFLNAGAADAYPPVVDVAQEVAGLVDQWCERRCLRALREILGAWPMVSGMTDDWGRLDEALKGVRAFASDELTDSEKETVESAIAQLDHLLFRRHS